MARKEVDRMSTFTTADARNRFGDVINRAAYGRERIVLTRRGKKIVAIVPVSDLEVIEKLEDMIDVRDADAALKEYRKKGGADWEKFKKELGY